MRIDLSCRREPDRRAGGRQCGLTPLAGDRSERLRVVWVGKTMRFTHSRITRALVTLVTTGCIGGVGSGLMGVSGGNGANGTHAPPVLAFFVQPNSVNVGQVISPPVEVIARDS